VSRVENDGDPFHYLATPHEHGGGFSYTIQMSSEAGDVIHVDTKPGTVLVDEEIAVLRAYFQIVRKRGLNPTLLGD
jgi:hypothetical protein